MTTPLRISPPAVRWAALLLCLLGCVARPRNPQVLSVGVARVDVSPTHAVRLMGYAARAQLPAPTNIAQRIHARALAIGEGPQTALLLTLDNCILPAAVTDEVRQRLGRHFGISPAGIALSVTHTHSAPCLRGAAPNIFAADPTAEDLTRISRYTDYLIDRLESVSAQALQDRRPARLAWGQGSVGFAKNRRTAGGPVDHSLPVLRVTAPDGTLRAVFTSYACHCTTLGGELNAVHGDWAGVAAQALEQAHPGLVALVAIGAGADANPDPRGTLALVEQHGTALAKEVNRLLSTPLTELTNPPVCQLRTIQLPFKPHFTRPEWEQRATNSGIVGYHARKWLARIDRGEPPSPTLPYPVQTWRFGDQLAMVFLGGEVVVDYSLRLKRELDSSRLWVNAYVNDVPCYIPSRRILSEGGYEAETSLWYYDRPQQLAPETENLIIEAVRSQLPDSFQLDEKQAENPPPKSPAEARNSLRLRPGLEIELVASEPLVESPVAIDFGADGRLWVCEMRDYPSGLDGHGQPGGRVKVLTDTNGDGRFDHAEIVADGLPFPTGLMTWHDGVIVCAAPDVWFFGPQVAQPPPAVSVQQAPSPVPLPKQGWHASKLLTGFATHNFQARVNGLRWGLDGWVYGSGGLFGGKITVAQTGKAFDCSNRDFRFKPDTGEFEPLAGVSQQGRVRDDFGEWFGQDNSTLLWHFPLPDHYARRNPHVVPPSARLILPATAGEDIGRVFPASRTLTRFNDPHAANRLTSACGPEIYRDELLGPGFAGNAFVCEPVHNLVRRAVFVPDGLSYTTHRAADEANSEFLASTDNWFRPVEVRTGPDGALWVVDFYRFVVEHPRWIPAERLKELDPRAGADKGRIWRVFPTGKKPRPIRDLTKLTPRQLAEVLDSPNGVERDLAHRRLLEVGQTSSLSLGLPAPQNEAAQPQPATHTKSPHKAASPSPPALAGGEGRGEVGGQDARTFPEAATAVLDRIATTSHHPTSRAQALAALAQLGSLTDELLTGVLRDPHPSVRRLAVSLTEPGARTGARLSEPRESSITPAGGSESRAPAALLALTNDPDSRVRYQLALTLGEFRDPAVGPALVALARRDVASPWHRAAILSSALAAPESFAAALAPESDPALVPLREAVLPTFVANGEVTALAAWLSAAWGTPADRNGRAPGGADFPVRRAEALRLLAALSAKPDLVRALEQRPEAAAVLANLRRELASTAATLVTDATQPDDLRAAALDLRAASARTDPARLPALLDLLDRDLPPALQASLIAGLGQMESPALAEKVLHRWSQRPPTQRVQLIGLLLGREVWTLPLLEATAAGAVAVAEISPVQRQQLRQHGNATIREKAAALFPAATTDRAALVAKFAAVVNLPGDPTRGAGHFDRLCASCHRLRGYGYDVGPDLAPFRGKPVGDFLTAILDPNAAIEPRFLAWTAELKDGRALTGIVRDESATGLKLLQPSGQTESLRRADLAGLTPNTQSLMPEGLEQSLTPADLADLIAWIKSTPAAFGSAGTDQAAEARRQFAGLQPARITALESPYDPLPYASWLGTLPLHYCRQTDGQSRLTVRFDAPAGSGKTVLLRFAAGMGFVSQPAGKFTLQLNGTPLLDFNVTLDDATWRSTDGRAVLRYLVRENGGQDSNGVLELEVASDLLKPAGNALEVTGSADDSQRWFGIYAFDE